MIGLLHNEWLKSWYGRKMWLFSFIMLILVAGSVGISLFAQFNMSDAITAQGFAEVSVFLFPMFVMIYGVILIAGAIAGEHVNGTIKQLLIRPASRSTLLASKWLGNALFSTLLFFLLIGITTAVGLLVFTSDGTSATTILNDMFSMGAYQLPTMLFYMALATLIAVTTKSTALTIVITFAPMFFGSLLQMFIIRYEWSKWIVLTHIDFFNNYHQIGMMPGPFESMWASLGFLFAHIALFLLIAHIVFQKRDVL
ncbi:ABC transporter permease [Shouchella patagoniensis]|uniref:ABC transporter permease n=1 Tax=Shouchella patagoniensis TaxID=228576 RepID=UPI0009949049|nr:ABC transporter permease subunit [Shouchella patagoniensis]